MKKQKKAKVITNIEAARNAHKMQRRHEKRQKEKQLRNKKSLRDKFRLKLEHGKQIQNDPDAFTNESQITINQNTTLNKFNPHNPANFPTTKNEIGKFDNEIEKLEAELNNLNQYVPQINKVEKFVGVNKGYRHTKDFLNKHNQNYELEETMGYHEEDEIEESVDRLDDLLAKKKQGQGIPFVGGPARVRRNPQPHPNNQQNYYPPQQMNQYPPQNPPYGSIPHQGHMPGYGNPHAPQPPQQVNTAPYGDLQFAKHSPQMIRKQPISNAYTQDQIQQNVNQLSESGEFVNTKPTQSPPQRPLPNKNKFSNHVSIRDSLDGKDLTLEEDPDDMVTFDLDQYKNGKNPNFEEEELAIEDNILPNSNDGYEIGAYKSGNRHTYTHNNPQKSPNVGSKPNFNFQKKDPSFSQMKTIYSEFPQNTGYNPEANGYPNTIQEVSAENLATPQAQNKKPTSTTMMSTKGKKKSLAESIEEEFEASQEETVVKGYAGRVQKMKKMKKRMEQKFIDPRGGNKYGRSKNRPPKQAAKKEVVVETEHGNMMVKGGVDLKKLFLS